MFKLVSPFLAGEIGRELMKQYGMNEGRVIEPELYVLAGRVVPTAHVAIQMGGDREHLERLLGN